jgi:hypothetical protein
MHGKFPAIQQNQRNSILFHETIPLSLKCWKNIGGHIKGILRQQ